MQVQPGLQNESQDRQGYTEKLYLRNKKEGAVRMDRQTDRRKQRRKLSMEMGNTINTKNPFPPTTICGPSTTPQESCEGNSEI